MTQSKKFDVVIVGAGFAGMYALHHFRSLGFSCQVFETADGVGGTWYWNRYPGARCDVDSLEYSYQFSDELQQEWNWSEKYAPQPEILEYANHVADRFDLRKNIRFNTRIIAMDWDENIDSWLLKSDLRENFKAKFVVMATGCLSKPNMPTFPGIESFTGTILHTSSWPHRPVSFVGKNVGIIGTGSSGVQSIPIIAEEAKSLTVFQRTPCYSIPARNRLMDKDYEEKVKANYSKFREENAKLNAAISNNPNNQSAMEVDAEERLKTYEQRWQSGGLPFLAAFNDLNLNKESNNTAVEFLHRKIKETVKNPEVANSLCPDTVVGCKRLCVDTNYYETYNRENVKLVDVSATPIEEIINDGLRTSITKYNFDTLIFATGFDAMTGALLSIDIRGLDGQTLKDKWQDGPKNYLGLTINGFPNLFTITGPGSPSVLANMIVAIEQHVEWVGSCLSYLRENSLTTIEASEEAEQTWINRVNKISGKTLYTTGCNSWYLGANIPGKPRIFMPFLGYPNYVTECKRVAEETYEGFLLSPQASDPKPYAKT